MLDNKNIKLTFSDDAASGKFQGWANYQTWNVALYLDNDFNLYERSKNYASYKELAQNLADDGIFETPDGIAFNDSALSIKELNELLQDDDR